MRTHAKENIAAGKATLGIELGSTRIKAVLIDETGAVLAAGSHAWENQYVDGVWTYALDAAWDGLRDCYAQLAQDVRARYDEPLREVAAIGVSAMMHGYLPFDAQHQPLTEFRTWRNLMTESAACDLTERFGFNIPQRWSVAHVYQAILNGEEHVGRIAALSTLAGYVHWRLTGERVVGVGEASGMFPIDSETNQYDARMVQIFDGLLTERGIAWKLEDVLPKVAVAGTPCGCLTEEGAALLDATGTLRAGAPFCPPEGDAQTGMVATNSVAPRTGNVSAGTSVFGMVVMEKGLSRLMPAIEVTNTPTGKPVAMVHCNNCTTDLNAWVNVFQEVAQLAGADVSTGELFTRLFNRAMQGEPDGGGLLAYNYDSGENIMGLTEGRPLFVRSATSRFSLANFMRTQLYSAMATLKAGFDLLLGDGGVKVDKIYAHGGFFKTEGVGQNVLVSALNAPVTVLETATEGGAWGIALLAAYMLGQQGRTLEQWLSDEIFRGQAEKTMQPNAEDVAGFEVFQRRYLDGMAIECTALRAMAANR